MKKDFFSGHLKIPQVYVAALGAHGQCGGMSGVPLQAGYSPVEGAGGTVEAIGRQRADKGLLQTLEETTWTTRGHLHMNICFYLQ